MKDTIVQGSLRATDTLFSTTSQFQILRAPTSSGGTTYGPGSDKQILQSNGTSVYWHSIDPYISITAGTNSAAPKVNLTVGGVSGNAQSITTATTNVYGVTKLTDSFTSTDGSLAVTGKAINAALQTLDSTLPSGSSSSKTLTGLTITDGKIASATFKDISISPSQISSAVPVSQGGTGTTTLTNGAVLIGNGTSSVNTRSITNNTSATAVTASTNIITANTLYYHTGNSNIKTVGTISSGTWQGTAIAAAYIGEHSTDKLTSGTLGTGRGGTGIDTYTLGDILYSSAADTLSKLSGNTTTTRKFLRSVAATSGTAAAPVWDTLTKTDVGLGNVENTALSTWEGSSNVEYVNDTLSLKKITADSSLFGLYFTDPQDNYLGAILYNPPTYILGTNFWFISKSFDDNGNILNFTEAYYLPNITKNLNQDISYNILTTKNTVTIPQGGTGATTAASARANLDVPSTTGLGASGTWGISISGNAANVTGTVAIAHGGTSATTAREARASLGCNDIGHISAQSAITPVPDNQQRSISITKDCWVCVSFHVVANTNGVAILSRNDIPVINNANTNEACNYWANAQFPCKAGGSLKYRLSSNASDSYISFLTVD